MRVQRVPEDHPVITEMVDKAMAIIATDGFSVIDSLCRTATREQIVMYIIRVHLQAQGFMLTRENE